jgi:hypothetical protein
MMQKRFWNLRRSSGSTTAPGGLRARKAVPTDCAQSRTPESGFVIRAVRENENVETDFHCVSSITNQRLELSYLVP